MWWLLCSVAWGVEWRAEVGGEIQAGPFGFVEAGIRKPDWSVELYTDTLDIRTTPHWDRGRGWMGVRSQFGYAGMFPAPWTDGRPDPGSALAAFYSGGEGGALHYFPRGFYAGAQALLRYWIFARYSGRTEIDVPEPRPVLTPDILVGIYREREGVDGWVRAGMDWQPGTVAPHVQGQLKVRLPWTVAPLVRLYAGWAQGQDDITRTRLGGMNPYVVPLAGAAWAEWRVEDYAVVHVGPEWATDFSRVAIAADLGWFDGDGAVGFELRGTLTSGRRYLEAAVGYAPWIPRPDRNGRTSVLLRAGWEWGTLERSPRQRRISGT